MSTSRVLALLVMLAAPAFAGTTSPAPPPSAPQQDVSAGPIRVQLTLDRATLNAAESLGATLTVRAPIGVRLTLPPSESILGGFSVASITDEPARTVISQSGQEQILVRRYVLDPFLPGDYTLPSIEVRWKRGTESGAAKTAEVKVPVLSLLPESASAKDAPPPDPGTIRDAYVAQSRSAAGRWWAIGVGAALPAVIGTLWWARARRRNEPDVLLALHRRVEILGQEVPAAGPRTETLHDLASTIRLALAAANQPSVAAAAPHELAERLTAISGIDQQQARHLAQSLAHVDAARFSGSPMPAQEFRDAAASAAQLIDRLRSLRSGEVKT